METEIHTAAKADSKTSKNSQPSTRRPTSSLPLDTPQAMISRSFNKSMSLMRVMVFFFGGIVLLCILSAFFFAYQANDHAQSRAFIVTELGTLYGYGNSSNNEDPQSKRIEIENHIKLFVSNMFSFDEGNYKDHIERGLELIGNDGKSILNQYNQIDIYNSLRKSNTKVTTFVDSIWVDTKTKPYRARLFARQDFETSASREQYWLRADMTLRNVSRTSLNVHGLKIDNWNIIQNGKIQ